MNKISNLPVKGTSDWFPEEFRIRQYIFNNWRKVARSFGYEEYMTPIVEDIEVYRAKSGDEVGGVELWNIEREGESFAIRPEMTPSVTRMVTRFYESAPKPIRLFSIANFMRYQRPQRGRNREFWQLNFDIFGSERIEADIEVLQMALEIMLSFNPPKGSFTMFVNDRVLIDYILSTECNIAEEQRKEVVRMMDKFSKMSREEFAASLTEIGIDAKSVDSLVSFLETSEAEKLVERFPAVADNTGFIRIMEILRVLNGKGYSEYVKFQPNIIRGFDYYDGMVFEVFDNNPENNRSLFGGGRYNGLAGIFGVKPFPAVGCAPGDETFKLFLEAWNLLGNIPEDETYYLPRLSNVSEESLSILSKKLRSENKVLVVGLEETGLMKSFEYGEKRGMDYLVIFGEEESKKGVYKLRNLKTREEVEYTI
jgi:histidyl-tRNA synthetase